MIRKAKMQGIDMTARYTMFRKFLHDSPCYDVDQTLDAIIAAFCIEDLHPGHSGKVAQTRRTHYMDGTPIPKDDLANTWPELAKAVALIERRNPQHHGDVTKMMNTDKRFRPEGYQWCVTCPSILSSHPQPPLLKNASKRHQMSEVAH